MTHMSAQSTDAAPSFFYWNLHRLILIILLDMYTQAPNINALNL